MPSSIAIICLAACVFAAIAGFVLCQLLVAQLRSVGYRRRLERLASGVQGFEPLSPDEHSGIYGRTLALLAKRSRRCAELPNPARRIALICSPSDLGEKSRQAGFAEALSPAGYFEARLNLSLLGFACGFVLGSMGSLALALLLGLAGLAIGWVMPARAMAEKIAQRADEAERSLPEMLDVVSLGLRSGLSFDRSLEFYLENFDNQLAKAWRSAHSSYSQGLATREEALSDVAASFDSPALAQVIGNINRSLRFGSSLVEPLGDAAHQVRADYKARKEEEVAKAPVKMMVPTGALILPAMLILVLGPVMLELATGF